MSKYERLLQIVNLLKARRYLRVKDLSQECAVSERTVYRDIAALAEAGLPIYFDRGYRILPNAFLPPLNLTTVEYFLLRLSLNSSPLMQDPEYRVAKNRLLAKLENCLKDKPISSAEDPFRRLGVKLKASDPKSVLSANFKMVEGAITANRLIEVSYDSLTSGLNRRVLEPYALVFRSRAWYLIAFCHLRRQFRLFRFSRFREIQPLKERFKPDSNFSVEKFFTDSWELYSGKPFDFKVKFWDKACRVILSGIHHASESVTLLKEGSLIYSARAAGEEEILKWILGFGGMAEVLSPKRLRKRHLDTIKAMGARYGGP
jgi:predicted DNA-binding transcriptional regulator YafY